MSAKVLRKVVAFDTWQKSVVIYAGYSVFIHYKEGLWNINPGKHGPHKYGPEGSAIVAEKESYPMPGQKEGCLLGRVIFSKEMKDEKKLKFDFPELEEENDHNDSIVFAISREGILVPKTNYTKVLHMRCNDVDTGVFDNVGELMLELEIW